ncbi:hypothetical protein BA190_27640 [Labrys sp. WJW]|uniref:hypothetical protein n=1 Tax=Labrys sp. WJW TaxID=1737983 RepID=UPI000829B214|nr:hypothetical protein [Labrys sp. WJW]OCC01737.1 hypothetical protein BA190_27640 [Labrys sp. WJW]
MTKRIPAPHFVETYIDAIGVEPTIQFLLKFGGGTIHLHSDPGPEGALAQAIGLENARALGQHLRRGHIKVPVAKQWIARQLFAYGWKKSKIARRLHVTDETVRLYLKGFEQGSAEPITSRQLDLFR